jgi:hypothetical protein
MEGATENLLEFILSLKSIYNKSFHFNEQNVFLKTAERSKTKKFFAISLF